MFGAYLSETTMRPNPRFAFVALELSGPALLVKRP
jgi:hypothetical protein